MPPPRNAIRVDPLLPRVLSSRLALGTTAPPSRSVTLFRTTSPTAPADSGATLAPEAPAAGVGSVVRSGLRGRVKWFDDRRGYGFIQPDRVRQQVFVHQSAIVADGFRTLVQGQEVQFDLIRTAKGVQAHNVMVAAPGRRSSGAGPGRPA